MSKECEIAFRLAENERKRNNYQRKTEKISQEQKDENRKKYQREYYAARKAKDANYNRPKKVILPAPQQQETPPAQNRDKSISIDDRIEELEAKILKTSCLDPQWEKMVHELHCLEIKKQA